MVKTETLYDSDVLDRLGKMHRAERLAHAYLFTGPRGIGKKATAVALACLVNCLSREGFQSGCTCVSCRKINDGNHPDIYIIERLPDKEQILLEQLKNLMSRLELRPIEAAVKVAIIRDADFLRHEAANAFLKTLEEPRPGTLLLLTCQDREHMLPTIASRCHEVRLFALAKASLADRVSGDHGEEGQAARILARFSEGSPGYARELGSDFLRRRNVYIDDFILGSVSDGILKKYSADRTLARELLNVVLMFYRDVLCVQSGVERDLICNLDRVDDVMRVAAKISAADVHRVIQLTLKAIEASATTFNMKVALTVLKEFIS